MRRLRRVVRVVEVPTLRSVAQQGGARAGSDGTSGGRAPREGLRQLRIRAAQQALVSVHRRSRLSAARAMMSGDSVQWVAEGGAVRCGVYVRPIPAGELPALPTGVGKQRQRFRESLSMSDRALVRDTTTGFYYAPRADSLALS